MYTCRKFPILRYLELSAFLPGKALAGVTVAKLYTAVINFHVSTGKGIRIRQGLCRNLGRLDLDTGLTAPVSKGIV